MDLVNLFCFSGKESNGVGKFHRRLFGDQVEGLGRRRFLIIRKIADRAVGIKDDGGFGALDRIEINRLIQAMIFKIFADGFVREKLRIVT